MDKGTQNAQMQGPAKFAKDQPLLWMMQVGGRIALAEGSDH